MYPLWQDNIPLTYDYLILFRNLYLPSHEQALLSNMLRVICHKKQPRNKNQDGIVASTKMCACMILSNNGTKCFELKYLNLNQIWQKTNLHHWQLQTRLVISIFLWNLSLMRLWLTIVLCTLKFRIEIVGMKWQLSDKPWQVGSVLDAYTLYMYIFCYLVIQSFRMFVLYSNVLSFLT